MNKRSNNSLKKSWNDVKDFGMIIIERVEGQEWCQRRRIENWVKAELVVHLSQFFSRPENSTDSRYPRRTFLIESWSAYYHKVWAAESLFFVSTPYPCFLSICICSISSSSFCILCFFLNFTAVFAHCSDFCILSQVIGQMCFCRSKCIVMWVKQTNRPCLRDTFPTIKTLLENCWGNRLHTDRERE